MNILKQISIAIIIGLLLTSCVEKKEGFTITGHIDGIKDGTLIKLLEIDQQTYLDSAVSVNGDFILQGEVDQPTGCWLQCESEYAIVQVENVEITFESPIKDMVLNCTIKGGREQELQNELDDLQYPYNIAYAGALDSLQNKKYTSEKEFQRLKAKYQRLQPLAHKVYVDFGRSHTNSYLGLDIIYRNRGRIGKDTLRTIYENLDAELKQSSNAVALQIFLYEEYAEVGKRFIDFKAKDLKGNYFTLSSLEGKYIYLNFWGAGCGPCRMENKVISKNYNRVPDNLAIVNFSLDKNASAWDKASKADSIIWHNVSDLEGGKGRVKTIYGVQAIPASFLIDENGIIVKRFYGFDTSGGIIDDLIKIIEGKV